jgi:hypothetical protein
MTSGGAIEEKIYATNAFIRENFSAIKNYSIRYNFFLIKENFLIRVVKI